MATRPYNRMLFPTLAYLNGDFGDTCLHTYSIRPQLLTICPPLVLPGERRATCQAQNSYLSSLRVLFFFSEWETHDLLLAVITLLKEAPTSDRSIYYANYTFKSTANAKPKVESAVITGARTVSHRSVCDKRLKKKKRRTEKGREKRCFHPADLKCGVFKLKEHEKEKKKYPSGP